MRLPKIRELIEAIKILLFESPLLGKGFTSKFPFKIEEQHKNMRGLPEIQDECIGCGACAESCPAKAIEIIDDEQNDKRTLRYDYTRCILCNTCYANCTTGEGVLLKDKYDAADVSRDNICDTKEFDLIKCEECGKAITTKDHLLWIAKKSGTAAYNNPTLYKILNISNEIAEDINISLAKSELRADIGKYLCPEHKRESHIKELWS